MAKSKTRDFFVWTDDEVELLLKVTHEYKGRSMLAVPKLSRDNVMSRERRDYLY